MEIPEIKKIMKERHITYDDLSNMTGISKSAITKIFGGFAKYPRVDTIRAIEQALGISDAPQQIEISDDRRRLLAAYNALIPPMQELMLATIENAANQPQNRRKEA